MVHYLGVDLGGTHIRAAVATGGLDIAGRATTRTPDVTDRLGVELTATVRAACEDAGVTPATVAGVGIASAGPFDRAETAVVDPANLPVSGRQFDLAAPVRSAIPDAPMRLLNDATAGVVGERHLSDGEDRDLVYLTISTGIGAGVVVDGSVLSGHGGNAGEVGHLTVDPAGAMTCGCGGVGHWEAYCSGRNVPRYAAFLHRTEGVETDLPVGEVCDPGLDAAAVFDAAGEDDLADVVVERVARFNAAGVADVVHAYAPRRVVFGGAVALRNPDAVVGAVRDRLPERLVVDAPRVEPTDNGDEVVLVGALVGARRVGEWL